MSGQLLWEEKNYWMIWVTHLKEWKFYKNKEAEKFIKSDENVCTEEQLPAGKNVSPIWLIRNKDDIQEFSNYRGICILSNVY